MADRLPVEMDDPAHSLTTAVIGSSPTPLLLLDGDLRVAGASLSFCEAFGIDQTAALGTDVFELGSGEWQSDQLRTFLISIASGTPQVVALETELERPGLDAHCLLINARRLVYEGSGPPRLLMAVADITQARANERAKDEAIERLGVLLSEVRHRVANSLQIVSSLLLQTARHTKSAKSRASLTDAHSRIMSVAALERQLSAAPDGMQQVELNAYFSSLCDNISASIIGHRKPVVLTVAGGGLVTARVSISLGLIVTELIINALKHAFPSDRGGRIEINYQSHGPNWTLSVRDDGIGMPIGRAGTLSGLGTNIVQALALQLEATVEVAPAAPGTVVNVEHIQVALVGDTDGNTAAVRPNTGQRPARATLG